MSKFSTKLISVAISAATIVSFSGSLIPAVQAQSATDLQAMITSLLAQVQQLQAKLNASGASTSSFTRDLTVGSKGDDVSALQNVLIGKGYLKIAAATGYFGSLTKAAVAAWQKAVGISPTAGYFGSKSRAALGAVAVTPPGVTPPGVTPPGAIAPATGLAVSLASTNPVAGSLIPASSRNKVLSVTLTAGISGPVTVSELKFKKVGVLSDSSISGAYIQESGKVVAQYNSISSGVVNFAGLSLAVAAGQSRTFDLAIDPAAGLSAGNTVSFSLQAASVTAWDASNNAVTATGVFPLQGNIFTVTTVSNPSLATLTVASSSIGTNVTAGTTNTIVGAWNFTGTNSKINFSSIKFQAIGSATMTDIKNVKLLINGTQVGQTLASVGANREAYFDASAAPGVLNTGSNNVQVYADVMGSPSYNFQFEILNAYDIYALDSQYNIPVAAAANTGTQVSISAGTVTVSQSSDTPTGNVAKGQSSITLAKFKIYAAGEAVKVKWLGVGLNLTGATTSVDLIFRNLSLTDDAGGQVGTTINTLSTSVTCGASGTGTDAAFTNTSSTYRNCFGNSTSPINYIVPANTTRVLSLKVDVQSTAGLSTVVGILSGDTSNLQGLTSSATASSAATNGSALTLASSNLTTAMNTSIGTQNISSNTINKKIGSYAFTASSAEGVTVSNVSVKANSAFVANLLVKVGSTQFGTTVGTVSSGTTYSFSGSPFTVPAGGTTYVDVYVDALSGGSGGIAPATVLAGCSGSGAVSYTAISCASTNGQGITFAGQSTVIVAADSATPAASQLVMGSTGQSLAIFRFTETSNVEDVKITALNVFDTVATTGTVKSGFGSMSLYQGTTPLGTAGSAVISLNSTTTGGLPGFGYYYKFYFATPIVVPQANSISLTLKGDVSSYSSSGATDNTTHVFKIVGSGESDNGTSTAVVALGSTSNATSAVTLSSANGNAQTVLRTKLTVSATPNGVTSGRSKQATDDLAYVNFAADSAGVAQIGSVTVTFSGSGPSTTAFYQLGTAPTVCTNCMVSLLDTANGASYYAVASGTISGNSNSLTFSLVDYQLSNGTSKSFTLRINSAGSGAFGIGTTGVSQTLAATINAATGVTWKDALDAAAVGGLNLQANAVPIQLNAVSYAAGS